ncbi:hypothetical protein GX586_07620 [bacterium]|nr:hypothetical protein [bacterium]
MSTLSFSPRRFVRRHIALAAFVVIAAAGVLAYLPSFTAPFHLDDLGTFGDPQFKYATPRELVTTYPTRWLPFLTFWLNANIRAVHIGRLRPIPIVWFHIVNCALHIVAAWLVFALTRTLWRPLLRRYPAAMGPLSSRWAPLFCGVAFAVHPLCSQAVIYLSQRVMLMASVCYLAALLCAARTFLPCRARWAGWAGAAVCIVIGAFCKEIIVTAPLAIAVMWWLVAERKPRAFSWRRALAWAGGAVVIVALPAAVLFTLAKWDPEHLRQVAGAVGGPLHAHTQGLTRATYAYTQSEVLLRYMRLAVWPSGFSIDHDVPLIGTWRSIAFLLRMEVLLLLALLAFRRRVYAPLFFWGAAVFFLTLLPQSSIIPTPDLMFEHRAYLGVAGVIWVVVSLAGSVLGVLRSRAVVVFIRVLAVAIIAAVASVTWMRTLVWQDSLTLWLDAYRKAPDKQRVVNNFAEAAMAADEAEGPRVAAAIIERHLPLWSNVLPGVLVTLGTAYAKCGEFARATNSFELALTGDPSDTVARYNYAILLHNHGLRPGAVDQLQKLLLYHPRNADAHFLLGVLLASTRSGSVLATNHLAMVIELVPGTREAALARTTIERIVERLEQQK